MMKNKKGVAPLILAALIIGGLIFLVTTIGGITVGVKLNNLIQDTPAAIWYIVAIILVLMMLRRKK